MDGDVGPNPVTYPSALDARPDASICVTIKHKCGKMLHYLFSVPPVLEMFALLPKRPDQALMSTQVPASIH